MAQELAGDALDWWVLESDAGALLGFLGYTAGTIEGLFVDPDARGQGAGRFLVAHAQQLAGARWRWTSTSRTRRRGFYEAQGFAVIGRSPTDGGGRPFPLLH